MKMIVLTLALVTTIFAHAEQTTDAEKQCQIYAEGLLGIWQMAEEGFTLPDALSYLRENKGISDADKEFFRESTIWVYEVREEMLTAGQKWSQYRALEEFKQDCLDRSAQ